MRRFLLFLSSALTLLLALPAWAQTTSVFIWKVSRPETPTRCSYLIGTVHLPMASQSTLPQIVKQAIASSSTFVMETDLSRLTPSKLRRFINDPQGNDLQRKLEPSEWKKLVGLEARKGVDEAMIPYFKPWFLSLMISMPANPPQTILDSVLRSEAEADHLTIAFLETPSQQFAQLDRVDSQETLLMLKEAIDDPQHDEKDIRAIAADYRRGNLKALERDVFDPFEMKQTPDFYRCTIDQRNARWLPTFQRAAAHGRMVIAVGLAHLIGRHGLLLELKKEGYRVERLSTRPTR